MRIILTVAALLAAVVLGYLAGAAVLLVAWNSVAALTDGHTITLLQALVIELLSTLVLGVLSVTIRG